MIRLFSDLNLKASNIYVKVIRGRHIFLFKLYNKFESDLFDLAKLVSLQNNY